MGMTYAEAYNLPIWKRAWYLERVVKEINKAHGDSKGTPKEHRGLSNKMRPAGPQRTKRFT